jgi:excisionase family DNA binding protein
MQAYATAKRPVPGERLRILDPTPPRQPATDDSAEPALLDQLLGRLADLVVERMMERADSSASQKDEWMDARGAATYLGVHRDTLRKLAAQRAVPVHQDGPRCKLYFRRDDLDHWRQSAASAGLRAVR